MARASGSSASLKHAVSNCELSTLGIGASFSQLSMQVANTSSLISYVFLQIARINGVVAVIVLVLSFDNLLKTVPLCRRSRVILCSLSRKCGSRLARSRSFELQARPEGIAGVEETGSLMCTKSKHTIKSNRTLVQCEGVIRAVTLHVQFCLP